MNTQNDPEDPIQQLVGLDVSSVCFVADYVELHFDPNGEVLRAISDPFGVQDGHEWQFPRPGSMDLLHRYIGKTVDGYELIPGRHLALHFGEDRFIIPLDDETRVGPEAAHYLGPDGVPGGMWIW
ncbi:hypothetical protein ACFWFU_05945 [Streptomyces sp. NPDC060235]|uniref:hypothetical protein n=1 Tax=Streptomyces sp. NPDC060235 TaxID=3347080 RepID=UPI00364B0E6D